MLLFLVAAFTLSLICSIPLAGLPTAGPVIGGQQFYSNPTPDDWNSIFNAVKANDPASVERFFARFTSGPPDAYEPQDTLFLTGRYKLGFAAEYQRSFCGDPAQLDSGQLGYHLDAYRRALQDATAGKYASAIREISESGTGDIFPYGQITLGQLYWFTGERDKARRVWRYATLYSHNSKSPDSGPDVDTVEALKWYIYSHDHKG